MFINRLRTLSCIYISIIGHTAQMLGVIGYFLIQKEKAIWAILVKFFIPKKAIWSILVKFFIPMPTMMRCYFLLNY